MRSKSTIDESRRANQSVQFRRLEALLDIAETIGKASSLERMLQDALDAVLDVTGMDSGGARLYDESNACFRLVGHRGMSHAMRKELMCIPADRGFPAESARKGAPVFTSDLGNDPRTTGAQFSTVLGYQSLISVPLLAEDRVVGTMELSTKQKHSWTDDEVRWLATIGRLVGLSVHQIRRSELALGLAMLQERGRLGREIHDGLAQLLGTLPLWADEVREAYARGEEDLMLAALGKIERAADDAYASLREEILGLRTTSIQESGLSDIIRDFLDRFSRQWGLETELRLENGDWSLTPSAEMQLLRVIQEALSNVRRHAEAQRVEVSFNRDTANLHVTVCDDGKGFDPQAVSEGHHGLRIMQERLTGVGGALSVESESGKGTCIHIDVPLAAAQPSWESV